MVLVSAPIDGSEPPGDVIPAGLSVRTQVHEYGGRCFAVHDRTVVFSNWEDQRLWMIDGGEPMPLTPEPQAPRGSRYADPVISPDGQHVICVRETHANGTVVNDLVSVSLAPDAAISVLAAGHDFYGSPRISPDGTRLCWVTWDLPEMPWDSTELWVADVAPGLTLGPPRRVAGGPGESVTQPRWSPAGVLHFVSDRSGWWNLYTESGQALCPLDSEFAAPDWVFGTTSYGFAPDGQLVATWSDDAGGRIGLITEGQAHPAGLPFTSYTYVHPTGGGDVFCIAASPVTSPAIVRVNLDAASVEVVKASRQDVIGPGDLSQPVAVEFPTSGGATSHAWFYPPTNAEYSGPPGERPPVVVILHGGPTASTTTVLNLAVQYWTSRGFAVADVDYRGSSGYGRAYRRLLDGAWGVADVEDCAAVVSWLDAQQLADGARAVIRGGSAGGFTTLAALTFTDVFAAGASHFGVADLELLAKDTHKFESRYLDGLVGPWPASAEIYQRRSPIHHVDGITSPLILFQGLEDMVVPPEQSQLMFDALSRRGIPVAYMTFEGEQHGFRKAETIMTVMAAELAFYGRVLGFQPDGDPVELDIANAEALNPRC
jgi:dipeptidyl aminopeptidase/acylaminoacyl peptidase